MKVNGTLSVQVTNNGFRGVFKRFWNNKPMGRKYMSVRLPSEISDEVFAHAQSLDGKALSSFELQVNEGYLNVISVKSETGYRDVFEISIVEGIVTKYFDSEIKPEVKAEEQPQENEKPKKKSKKA